ncbi:uncharacterized protein C4orf50 homolog [Rhynchonycteris naso]
MEPTAQGHSEKTFSYVVRAPGSDGFDVMNVDVKIDTSWVFQDAEDGGEEPGCLLEGAARSSPDVDTGTLRRQLESSEQKLLAAVDKYVTSESGLRSRVQELELSERQLLRKVDQLSARVHRERSASLHAQEQLEALQGELASQVLEKERAARRQRWRVRRLREQLRHKDEALGQQTAALERCRRNQRRELGLVREQERVLRVQVQRLELDVRRLCRAAGLLLAELDTPTPGSPRAPAGTDPQDAPEEAAELRALQARAERGERERDQAARRLREQRATERQLRAQLEELRCCLYELQLSEIGLQGQVEDLAQQNRSLREELGAQVLGERVRSKAPVGHGSLDTLGRGQDECLRLSPEEASGSCRSQCWQTSVHPDSAPGPWASAGQPAAGPCAWGSAGAGRGPPVLVPGLETMARFLGDMAGPDHAQPAPAEPSLHEQTLLLVCGCPSGLLPMEPAWMSGRRLPAAPAQESFLLVQTSTLPPWGSAGDPAALLLPEASAGELYIQQGLDDRPLPAPRAFGQPCRDHPRMRGCGTSLCQECPPLSHHRFPGTGPTDLNNPWKEGGGTPEWRPEDWDTRRTWGRKEGDLRDRYLQHQESHERLGLKDGAGALEGPQSQLRASEPQATASCPWPRQELPLPLLQGAASVSMEGSKSLRSRRQMEERVCGLLGRLPSVDEEWEPPAAFSRAPGAKEPSPAGGQLFAEQDRATGRLWSKEKNHVQSGNALLLLKESPGREGRGEEEEAVYLEESSLGYSEFLGEPVSKESEAKETLFSVEKGGLPLFFRLAVSPQEAKPTSSPRASRKGPEASVVTIDTFAEEMEACFWHLSILELGSGGQGQKASVLVGEDGSLAGWWHSDQGPADPQQVWADQGLHTRPVKEADPKESHEGIKPGETEVPSHVLPGTGPDSEDPRPGPEGTPEWGQDLCPPSRAVERARRRFHQLISALKKERSEVLHDNVKLQRDHARCHRQLRALQAERERHVDRTVTLERDNGMLARNVSHLQGELDQYRQVVSDLEDCNRKSYSKISELEMENESLQRRLDQLQKAKSQSARRSQGATEDAARENRELSALISELGVSYKELIKDVVLGIEDMIRGLREENAHLLRRIRVLEREVASGVSGDVGRVGAAEEHPRGKSKVDAVERAVQVTQPSEQLTAGIHGGPSLEQEEGLAGVGLGPSAHIESSRDGAGSAAPSPAGRGADGSGALQGSPEGTGTKEARLGKEEERPGCSEEHRPALRFLSKDTQSPPPYGVPRRTEPLRVHVLPVAREHMEETSPWAWNAPVAACNEGEGVGEVSELLGPRSGTSAVSSTLFLKEEGLSSSNQELRGAQALGPAVPPRGISGKESEACRVFLCQGPVCERPPCTDLRRQLTTQHLRFCRKMPLRDPEAETSEEDLGLCVRQLRHQVLTLQCQLRDQGSAGRELQAAHDEALRLRDQLKGKVDELQKKQHEANLAVTPLKAKLASLVQKCRDRNRLLTHLLQELRRHGAADGLLSETVRSMVNDVALAEYAATFLPGVPERTQIEFPVEALGSGWQPQEAARLTQKAPLGLGWKEQTQEGWWVLGAPDRAVRLAYLPGPLEQQLNANEATLWVQRSAEPHPQVEGACVRKSQEEFLKHIFHRPVKGPADTKARGRDTEESPLRCFSFQTGCHLDAEPEETAAGGAQKYLLHPEMDGVFLRSLRSESWPLPEAEWPAQTARLDSLELPLPSGPTPDPGRRPAVATVASGAPAPCLQGKGGTSCPTLHADDLPPPSELTSPARILAFHRELRQSICGNSWVNKSPLEL